ncbi:unnamed protein product [Adineta ricciae]|uniref:Uncharacterized protein n=1 Tax=Adineta ricciae TaxID=249248 RepID=A0A814PPI8_ADIRI|nr:unnamed protein product [Adineta ricciae]
MMNSTVVTMYHHYESVDDPTAVSEIELRDYDSSGATLFLIVVIFWYALSIVCMLGMQIRGRAGTIEDCTTRRAKLFLQTLRVQTQTKQILEELVDTEKRERFWNIYFEKTDYNKEKLKRAERHRTRNIRKQLAAINRNRLIMNETMLTPVVNERAHRASITSQSTLIPHLSAIENQPRDRRRSSLDQQIIERWKSLVEQSNAHEQLPWPFRKHLICRHFRRYCKNSSDECVQNPTRLMNSSTSHEEFRQTNDDQCHLLPPDPYNHSKYSNYSPNEPNSPSKLCVTSFQSPVRYHSQSNIQNLPIITIKSDHEIVHLYHDESRC